MRILRNVLAASSIVGVLAACAPANGPAGEAAPADTLAYTGVVVQSGTRIEPAVVLEREDGESVRLAGALAPEIARLAGGTVRVVGHASAEHSRAFDVAEYELLEIAGGVPLVGVLETRSGELWLVGAEHVQLLQPPAELRQMPGARVWIVGETDGDGIRLQSYGVIAEP